MRANEKCASYQDYLSQFHFNQKFSVYPRMVLGCGQRVMAMGCIIVIEKIFPNEYRYVKNVEG